jgi:DNA-binding NarL/FixJ family response regulator
MAEKIRVAILENHQGIIDGYRFRLDKTSDIEIVATALCGEDLEPLLAKFTIDVLILDVHVPTSQENINPYPILHVIPRLLQTYPRLIILVISMHTQRKLIEAVMNAGASGYVLKDDQASIRDLDSIIRSVAGGGIYMSQYAYQQLQRGRSDTQEPLLTARQLEVLSLCAAFPEISIEGLASKLFIANSTLRNILSEAYLKLNVRTRLAAIARARQLGLIPPDIPSFEISEVKGRKD